MVKVNKIVKSAANPKLIKHTPITAEQIMRTYVMAIRM